MSATKKWLAGCGTIAVIVAVAIAVAGYIYGPAITAMTLGKPVYLVKPTPQKYGNDVLRIAESIGLYGDSPAFAEAKATAQEQLKGADSLSQTYDILRPAIKAAGGKHSNIVPPVADGDAGAAAEETPAPQVRSRGPVAMVTVPGISRRDDVQQYADTLAQGIVDTAQCGAVVDLRGNGGGDMGPMVAGLSPLLPDGPVLSFVNRMTTTDVTVEGNSVSGGGTALTTAGGKKLVPVAVLVDADTASSGEATMLAFRGLDNSRSFGSPTAGYASANLALDLYDEAELMITTAKDKARTGEEFAEDPIMPDEVTADAETEAAALAWLADQGCS